MGKTHKWIPEDTRGSKWQEVEEKHETWLKWLDSVESMLFDIAKKMGLH